MFIKSDDYDLVMTNDISFRLINDKIETRPNCREPSEFYAKLAPWFFLGGLIMLSTASLYAFCVTKRKLTSLCATNQLIIRKIRAKEDRKLNSWLSAEREIAFITELAFGWNFFRYDDTSR